MSVQTDKCAQRFEAFLTNPETASLYGETYSISKWVRLAGMTDYPVRKAKCQIVMDNCVADGRMIKGLAGPGHGFARSTIVYQIAPSCVHVVDHATQANSPYQEAA